MRFLYLSWRLALSYGVKVTRGEGRGLALLNDDDDSLKSSSVLLIVVAQMSLIGMESATIYQVDHLFDYLLPIERMETACC